MSEITPEFFRIDELRLDKECLEQPGKYFQIASDLADARRDLDKEVSNLKLVEAELATDIRKSPEDYKLDKVTESSVAATVPLQKDYQEALREVREAQHTVGVLTAAVTAMEHRKRSLTLLIDLHGLNYFSDPKNSAKAETRERIVDAGKKEVRSVGRLKRERVGDQEDES